MAEAELLLPGQASMHPVSILSSDGDEVDGEPFEKR